jgi:hypothetical protein
VLAASYHWLLIVVFIYNIDLLCLS